MQAYPAEAASAPSSHPSCLAGVVSRSQRWFVWTPSPLHSGNKPSWSLKSSPHELKSPSDKGRRVTPHSKYQKYVRHSTSIIQNADNGACCRIRPSFLQGKNCCQVSKYFDSLVKVSCQSSGYRSWQLITEKCAMQHVCKHIRWLQVWKILDALSQKNKQLDLVWESSS